MLGVAASAMLPMAQAAQSIQVGASDLDRVKVGAEAPGFTLPDASGKTHSLSAFRGKPAVLVFYRGYW